MTIKRVLTLFLALSLSAWQLSSQAKDEPRVRQTSLQVTAEIVDIDYETRELSLRTAMGEVITLTASDEIKRFKEFEKGDQVVTTYVASLEGDLRQPTEEEKANPWVELDAAAIAELDELPGVGMGRVIQAVCTIEGMNRVLGTVTILDPRGKLHMIGDVEPEDMEGVNLGDSIIVTYTEAVAIELKKHSDEG